MGPMLKSLHSGPKGGAGPPAPPPLDPPLAASLGVLTSHRNRGQSCQKRSEFSRRAHFSIFYFPSALFDLGDDFSSAPTEGQGRDGSLWGGVEGEGRWTGPRGLRRVPGTRPGHGPTTRQTPPSSPISLGHVTEADE